MARALKVVPGERPIPSWDSLWASFELELRGEHGVSHNTLRVYRESALQFVAWLQEQDRPTEPAMIERDDVQGFMAELRERGAKPATIRVRFSSLRRFFNWCEDEEEIPGRSPMHKMKAPKVDEPPPEVLTDDEITALLHACDGKSFEDRRDMALTRLMFDSGLRRFEAAGIAVEDLELEERKVRIIGKGQREEVAYFGAKTARDLDRYLRVRPLHWMVRGEEDIRRRGRGEATEEVHPLWLAQKGFLSPDGIHHVIARRAELAGIKTPGRRVFPHLLRHSFGDRIKAATGSDEVVMTLGRWRDAKAMRRYGASAAQQRAREAHRQASPGDRF